MVAEVRRGPRFDLLFEQGECHVRTQTPLVAGFARFDALRMAFKVGDAFPMSGGSDQVKHRRSRLVSAKVRCPHASVAQSAAAQGFPLRLETLESGKIRIEFEDAVGVVLVDLQVGAVGRDLLLVPLGMRWFRAGARSAWDRMVEVGAGLGVRFDRDAGGFVAAQAVRQLLAQALLPLGWRLPDDRDAMFVFELAQDGAILSVRSGPATPSDSASPLGRKLAAALASERDVTEGFGWLRPARSPAALPQLPDSGRWLELVSREEGAWMKAEAALVLGARLLLASDPDEEVVQTPPDSPWHERILRALASFPQDTQRHRIWSQYWATRGHANTLRLARMWLAGPLPRLTTAALVAETLIVFVETDPSLSDAEEESLLLLATRARRDAPDSCAAVAAHAHVLARSGQLETAVDAFVRAAELESSPHRAARLRVLAADHACHPDTAKVQLELALIESVGQPDVVVALARLMAEQGDEDRAAQLFGRLLRSPIQNATHQDALIVAARYHVERGHQDEAEAFLARLKEPFAESELAGEVKPLPSPIELFADMVEDVPSPSGIFPFDEAFPSQVFEKPPVIITSVLRDDLVVRPVEAGQEKETPSVPPLPDVGGNEMTPVPNAASGHLASHTFVAMTADSMRTLLDVARQESNPKAVLDVALTDAIANKDENGVRDVLAVLDRIGPFDDEEHLRETAQAWLDTH